MFLNADPLDWDEASSACNVLGGALASIHSQSELDAAVGAVTIAATGTWIGATDRATEGVWT